MLAVVGSLEEGIALALQQGIKERGRPGRGKVLAIDLRVLQDVLLHGLARVEDPGVIGWEIRLEEA